MIAGETLPRDAVCCLSKDAFRKEGALRVEGQPCECFSLSFCALNSGEMMTPHGSERRFTVRGELPRPFCLAGSMLLCEARPGPPPVNRRRAVSPSPAYP